MIINQSECSIRRFISIQVPRNNQYKTNKSEGLTRPDPPKSGKIVNRPDPSRGSIRSVDNSGPYMMWNLHDTASQIKCTKACSVCLTDVYNWPYTVTSPAEWTSSNPVISFDRAITIIVALRFWTCGCVVIVSKVDTTRTFHADDIFMICRVWLLCLYNFFAGVALDVRKNHHV